VWEVAEKEDTPEDPSKKTDKGKSSHASFVENLVTLQEIADRNDTAIKESNVRIKDHHQRIPGKLIKTHKKPFKV
jgi:hypothetical protein